MKMAAVGTDESASGAFDDLGGAGAAFKIGSYTSGGESVSFNSAALTSQLSTDAEFSQTVYGVQFLTLRKRYAMAITNAGERR